MHDVARAPVWVRKVAFARGFERESGQPHALTPQSLLRGARAGRSRRCAHLYSRCGRRGASTRPGCRESTDHVGGVAGEARGKGGSGGEGNVPSPSPSPRRPPFECTFFFSLPPPRACDIAATAPGRPAATAPCCRNGEHGASCLAHAGCARTDVDRMSRSPLVEERGEGYIARFTPRSTRCSPLTEK
jgi:hypothetical protein